MGMPRYLNFKWVHAQVHGKKGLGAQGLYRGSTYTNRDIARPAFAVSWGERATGPAVAHL